ncbi:MAG: hypothetical protein JW720_11485 [Sedimentisphaerales bacterium]|nr:hypothetical protein [Sedimentisphaerales bacterium]
MSNSIEFFQSAEDRLALPAATVSVEIGGRLCPSVEPVEIVRGPWPEFGWAKMAYNPAANTDGSLTKAEDIETAFAMGESVRIGRYYNAAMPASAVSSLAIFCGAVDTIETTIGPNGERVEIVARDFSANLRRITVYGRRVATAAGSTVFLSGPDTVFNPDGGANACRMPRIVNGKSRTTFCPELSQGRPWTHAEVIDYLLSEYLPDGRLQIPELERLAALTKNRIVRDLDVTGLTVLDAMHRCCERIGVQFEFVPRPGETGPRQAIRFYTGGAGRAVELNCQRKGRRLSISKTDIAGFGSVRNFWPVTHRCIGQGDFKVFEATFDLLGAWDSALEDTDYNIFSPSTNPDFYQVRDVYRKWCLNEAADYSNQPYNLGEPFDFSKIFGTSEYAQGRRRFYPALTADTQGKSLGCFLEVSYDGGTNWWQYLCAFNNLLDECGIWLSSDRLDMDTWVAALKGVLKFRITASVVSDQRLTCTVADGPVGSAAGVVEELLTMPRRFKFRKVSPQSIFAGLLNAGQAAADQADDTEALHEFVRHKAAGAGRIIETANVRTPLLAFDCQIGDTVVAGPDSRDLLSTRLDNRSLCTIERVRMDFKKQRTNLKIVRRRRQLT